MQKPLLLLCAALNLASCEITEETNKDVLAAAETACGPYFSLGTERPLRAIIGNDLEDHPYFEYKNSPRDSVLLGTGGDRYWIVDKVWQRDRRRDFGIGIYEVTGRGILATSIWGKCNRLGSGVRLMIITKVTGLKSALM